MGITRLSLSPRVIVCSKKMGGIVLGSAVSTVQYTISCLNLYNNDSPSSACSERRGRQGAASASRALMGTIQLPAACTTKAIAGLPPFWTVIIRGGHHQGFTPVLASCMGSYMGLMHFP